MSLSVAPTAWVEVYFWFVLFNLGCKGYALFFFFDEGFKCFKIGLRKLLCYGV